MCLDKKKFGGPGKKKQRCMMRKCKNIKSQRSALKGGKFVYITLMVFTRIIVPNYPIVTNDTNTKHKISNHSSNPTSTKHDITCQKTHDSILDAQSIECQVQKFREQLCTILMLQFLPNHMSVLTPPSSKLYIEL